MIADALEQMNEATLIIPTAQLVLTGVILLSLSIAILFLPLLPAIVFFMLGGLCLVIVAQRIKNERKRRKEQKKEKQEEQLAPRKDTA